MQLSKVLASLALACATPTEAAAGAEASKRRDPLDVTVMQFNMRVDSSGDDVACHSWMGGSHSPLWCHARASRRDAYVAAIREHQPDILGTQEGKPHQVYQVAELLHQSYGYLGRGRHKGGKDETSALFYRRADWTVEATGDFMFSSTPDQLGTSYRHASYPMISTWAVLARRSGSSQRFLTVVTHLDPYVKSVRELEAKQIVATVREKLKLYNCKYAVLLGDLNSGAGDAPYVTLQSGGFDDVYKSLHGPYGSHSFTFHNWNGASNVPAGTGPDPSHPGYDLSDPDSPVDFVMALPKSLKVKAATVDKNKYLGVWPSDHYPVVARVQIPTDRTPGYAWQSVKKGDRVPPGAVSSGGLGYVARASPFGEGGEMGVDAHGKVAWVRVQGYSQMESGDVLVLRGKSHAHWQDVHKGDRLPLGAVFTGFTFQDANMYVARSDHGRQTCKLNSDEGRAWKIWCYGQNWGQQSGQVLVVSQAEEEVRANEERVEEEAMLLL